MARITHVKKAQQRYETVPVIDPETDQPKQTPVMKDGKQKTTKRGKLVFMTVTAQDRTKPLAPYTCDYPGCPQPGKVIEVGTAYKHITPKSGPYGGRKRTRHESCPTWQVWEYSSSLSARLAQVAHDFWGSIDTAESVDDVSAALEDASQAVKDIAEEKRESASNIEEGFGHETSSSQELNDVADQLDDWADEITQADIPDLPDVEMRYFVTTGGGAVSDLFESEGYESEMDAEQALAMHRDDEGTEDDEFEIEEIEPDAPTEEQMDEWRSELQDALTIVDESPV